MRIIVGSTNPAKINAVKEIVTEYDFLTGADVVGMQTDSGVTDQPISLKEIITGAKNRAKNIYNDCVYSFGIADGMMKVPETNTGYMNICACAVFDGKDFHIGLSSAFEYPPKVIEYAFDKGLNINQAFFKAGLTKQHDIGLHEGAIGILTRGRLIRKNSIKQSIENALIHLDK